MNQLHPRMLIFHDTPRGSAEVVASDSLTSTTGHDSKTEQGLEELGSLSVALEPTPSPVRRSIPTSEPPSYAPSDSHHPTLTVTYQLDETDEADIELSDSFS